MIVVQPVFVCCAAGREQAPSPQRIGEVRLHRRPDLAGHRPIAKQCRGGPGFLIVYISVAAVTAAGGFALTATHFFYKRLKKVSKKTLAPASGPSPRLGVPSLRHSSGGTALRFASLHLHAACSTASNGAARPSPDKRLHSAFRRGGWIKIKSCRRANARPDEW